MVQHGPSGPSGPAGTGATARPARAARPRHQRRPWRWAWAPTVPRLRCRLSWQRPGLSAEAPARRTCDPGSNVWSGAYGGRLDDGRRRDRRHPDRLDRRWVAICAGDVSASTRSARRSRIESAVTPPRGREAPGSSLAPAPRPSRGACRTALAPARRGRTSPERPQPSSSQHERPDAERHPARAGMEVGA